MMNSVRLYRWAGVLALCAFAAAISAGSAAPRIPHAGAVHAVSPDSTPNIAKENAIPEDVKQRFEDAPYGVDPMVTGPVIASFRETQKAAGCDSAVWPNIPAVCYPD
jgi:hypothetical protein